RRGWWLRGLRPPPGRTRAARSRSVLRRHDVRDPGRILVGVRARAKGAVRLVRPGFGAFPVDGGRREARFGEQVAQLAERPEPPVVGPGALDLAAVAELEVDVAGRVVRDRVVAVLVPDVGEGADAAAFASLRHR